jgi:hypothetical protein
MRDQCERRQKDTRVASAGFLSVQVCDECSIAMRGFLHSLVGRGLIAPCVTLGLSPSVGNHQNSHHFTSSVLLFGMRRGPVHTFAEVSRTIAKYRRYYPRIITLGSALQKPHFAPCGQSKRRLTHNLLHQQQMSSLIIRGQHASRYISDPMFQCVIHPRHNSRWSVVLPMS